LDKSQILNSDRVSLLADKMVHARKLYGTDSSFVIGLISSFEWLLEGVEGGESTKRLLRDRILQCESGKSSIAAEEGGEISAKNKDDLPESTWIKGAVKWFNDDKGYGFISTESDSDVFVHWRDISSWDRSLSQGDEVEFMVTKTAKGFQAVNVMKAGQDQQETTEDREENQIVPEVSEDGIETTQGSDSEMVEKIESEIRPDEGNGPESAGGQGNSS
jgi:CspA family cold shock protein